jgi:cytochrome c oxidase subunit 2
MASERFWGSGVTISFSVAFRVLRGAMTRLYQFLTAVLLVLGCGVPQAFADQPKAWGLWTQEPVTPTMTQIVDLHSTITVIIIAITIFVFAVMGIIMVRFHHTRQPVAQQWSHNTMLEVVWTLIPVLILVGIAFPSFKLLYAMDRTEKADYTIKATGHQWYWSYSYPDQNINFDANMVQDDSLEAGQPRLLTADTKVVVPVGAVIRLLIASDDVIHSWSMPAFGVKTDAMPGRLNETWFKVEKAGTYYGQCSQLCGINHGFMPIEVQAVSKEEFDAWVEQNAQKSASASHTQLADARLTRE